MRITVWGWVFAGFLAGCLVVGLTAWALASSTPDQVRQGVVNTMQDSSPGIYGD